MLEGRAWGGVGCGLRLVCEEGCAASTREAGQVRFAVRLKHGCGPAQERQAAHVANGVSVMLW